MARNSTAAPVVRRTKSGRAAPPPIPPAVAKKSAAAAARAVVAAPLPAAPPVIAAPTGAAAEWVAPSTLKAWPKNPRKNDGEPVAKVAESIKRFGFAAPIVARTATREIIAGHTRWKAAQQLRLELVPVRWMNITEREAHLLALADNRLSELAEWDTPELHRILASYDLGDQIVAGWNEKDLRELERASLGDQELPDDVAPEPPTNPVTKPGDLWTLGQHRLVCGDCTDTKMVGLARAKLEPFIMVTDPPYGVEHDPSWREKRGVSVMGPQAKGLVENDHRSDWTAAWKPFQGRVAYVWHGALYASESEQTLAAAALITRAQIVWVKPRPNISRGAYNWAHEACWYVVREGGSAKWCGDHTQSTVWQIQSLNSVGGGARGTEDNPVTGHSTQKPIECMARPMRNHGTTGDVVYDPFCGSGTTLVAAEHLGRVCVALEITPAYCDVIVERWQRLTGGKAKRNEP